MHDMKNIKRADTAPATRSGMALDPNSQISRKLAELYNSVQDETIPDRFLDLLEKLDEAERAATVNNDRS